ncbi:MAG TPA: sialidase family protein [Gaiellaceae bacterium]
MTTPTKLMHAGAALAAALALVAITAGAGLSAPPGKFSRIASVNGGTAPQFGLARTANGTLHLAWQTMPALGSTWGLATLSISSAGKVGPQTQALGGWEAGIPGLTTLADGSLEAVFGAISPKNLDSLWGINSTDGGATWSAPADVKGGGPAESLVYGADVTAVLAGQTPVLTLPQAGNLVVQQGLGAGMPNAQVNAAADGAVGGVNSAVDAATHEAYASWQSLNVSRDMIQPVAPSVGVPEAVPGPMKVAVPITGRDVGAGIFAAYAPDGTHVRLLHYGGGSVAVGSVAGLPAKVLGVATGPQGRIWVMWGDDDLGIAVTRSNMAATAFEPIQRFDPGASTLWRLAGDGRLGPLDLIVAETPAHGTTVPGAYYSRILPMLTATFTTTPLKNKKGTVVAVVVKAHVTDAGDPVSAATVAIAGKTAKTNAQGAAKLTVAGAAGTVVATITKGGYQPLKLKVGL